MAVLTNFSLDDLKFAMCTRLVYNLPMSSIALRTLQNNAPSVERFRFSDEKATPVNITIDASRRARTATMQAVAKSTSSSPRYSFETACDVLANAVKNAKK